MLLLCQFIDKTVQVYHPRKGRSFPCRITRVDVDTPRVEIVFEDTKHGFAGWIDMITNRPLAISDRQKRQKLFEALEKFSTEYRDSRTTQPIQSLEDRLTDVQDMITFETDPEEPRYEMKCGHAITADSLMQFVLCSFSFPFPLILNCGLTQSDFEMARLEFHVHSSFRELKNAINCGIGETFD